MRIRTKVQANGRVDVPAADLKPGQDVDVTISPVNGQRRRSILQILAECRGARQFNSAQDVAADIREERDSWER